jgi:hypothetical protein
MVTARSLRLVRSHPNTRQWLTHELLSRPLLSPLLLRKLKSSHLEHLPMLRDFHRPNLLPVPRERSRRLPQMPSSVRMVGMGRVENLPCLRSHMKVSTSKPHLAKDHLKDISRHSPSRKRKPALSPPPPTSSPRTIQLIPSSEMRTATTNSNTASRVPKASRRAPPSSGHTVVMALLKAKEPPSFHRARLSSRSRGMPQLERVKPVATPRQTQPHRLSNLALLRLPSLNQATLNNPRRQAILTAILTTRARTTPST